MKIKSFRTGTKGRPFQNISINKTKFPYRKNKYLYPTPLACNFWHRQSIFKFLCQFKQKGYVSCATEIIGAALIAFNKSSLKDKKKYLTKAKCITSKEKTGFGNNLKINF